MMTSRLALKPSVALAQHREQVLALIAAMPTLSNPRVFGSVLHGTDDEDSDIDLLVDAARGTTFFDLAQMQENLCSLLGFPVQVLTAGGLSAKFRDEVLREAAPL